MCVHGYLVRIILQSLDSIEHAPEQEASWNTQALCAIISEKKNIVAVENIQRRATGLIPDMKDYKY